MALAQKSYDETKRLFEAGSSSKSDLELAEYRLEVAQAKLKLAEKLQSIHKG